MLKGRDPFAARACMDSDLIALCTEDWKTASASMIPRVWPNEAKKSWSASALDAISMATDAKTGNWGATKRIPHPIPIGNWTEIHVAALDLVPNNKSKGTPNRVKNHPKWFWGIYFCVTSMLTANPMAVKATVQLKGNTIQPDMMVELSLTA